MQINEYTFPFHTCEKPNPNGIAQPYSVFFNFINCAIIFYFLLKTKHHYTFLLLFSIFCFESFHLFSHIVHIPGSMQINITHSLSYLMNIAFFYTFYSYSNMMPSSSFLFLFFLLVCLDIYTFIHSAFIYYLITQSVVFISLLFYYFPFLPKNVQQSIYQIVSLVSIVILLFINEKYNCGNMMAFYADFPYHILIESVGILLFYVICKNFCNL